MQGKMLVSIPLVIIVGVVLALALGEGEPQPSPNADAVAPPPTRARPTTTPPPEPTATPTPRPTATPTPTTTSTPTPTPGPRAVGTPDYVPILMYHYVRDPETSEDDLGYGLSVSPQLFEEQLEWLDDNGYTTVQMRTLAACLREQSRCPDKPVALTFDDGYEDAFTNALPILKRHNATATFYVVPDFVGQPDYLTWEQIGQMHQQGMEIGSHTIAHRDLTVLEPDHAADEIERSRALIGQHIGAPVESFSYPYGRFMPALAREVQQAGYTNAVITFPSHSLKRLYVLPRRRVRGDETVAAMRWLVAQPYTTLVVESDTLNMRTGPSTDHPLLPDTATLAYGEEVDLLAQVKSSGEACEIWFEVQTADDTEGWICGDHTRLAGNN